MAERDDIEEDCAIVQSLKLDPEMLGPDPSIAIQSLMPKRNAALLIQDILYRRAS